MERRKYREAPILYDQNYVPLTIEGKVIPVWSCELPRGVVGTFNLINKRASVAKDQTPPEYASTAMHELTHKRNNYHGVNEPEIMTDMQMIEAGAPPFIRPAEFYSSEAA